ncbi:MAG: serine/threonine protein kinase [Deltaproteobacteria bacterium]|nr:serine/threonine protein kinase [Deltaproteobacteria bacterium]
MPENFGRYQLLSLIGRGGMAELYRARLETPAGAEKILVVKRILPSFSSDPEFLRLFINEAKIALPLTHGNITSVFEFGEVSGQYFLAMEYIHGQNLDAILRRLREVAGRMPIPAALFIAGEVAKGLAYAHGFTSPQGSRVEIVHLDVSPQNVLVSYDGTVKLTDFGIAKVKQSAEPAGVLRGKPSYLAPEQVDGGAVDARTDVFSLGSVLYQMLTGRAPFDGATDEETMQRLRAGEVEPLADLHSELHELEPVVMRALSIDPDLRYANANEFQVALSQAMFRHNPHYGSPQLAEWVRELFAWELFEAQGAAQSPLRDRLLFQLSAAKVEVDPEKSTKELLSMGTVSIPPPPPAGPAVIDPETRRSRLISGAFLTSLIILAAALAMALGKHFFGEDLTGLGPAELGGASAAAAASSGDATVNRGGSGTGILSLNAWPSAIVYLNGERLPGTTPILNHQVPEGTHKVTFERPELGLKKEIEVMVPAGAERTVAVTLDR